MDTTGVVNGELAHTSDNRRIGSVASFRCRSGFARDSGSFTATCIVDTAQSCSKGKWSAGTGTFLRCLSDPSLATQLTGLRNSIGDVQTSFCHVGYRPVVSVNSSSTFFGGGLKAVSQELVCGVTSNASHPNDYYAPGPTLSRITNKVTEQSIS